MQSLGDLGALMEAQTRAVESTLSELLATAEDMIEEGPEPVAGILHEAVETLLRTRLQLLSERTSLRQLVKSGTLEVPTLSDKSIEELPQYKTWIRILEVIIIVSHWLGIDA